MADQINAGNVDAGEVLEPFAGQLLAAGNRSIVDPLLSVGEEVLYTFWTAQRGWAESHRTAIVAFAASLEQARDYIAAHPDEARAVLARYTKLPAPVVERLPFATYRFSLDRRDFRVWTAVLKDLGQLPRPIDEDRLVLDVK
jgi:NitT/TauT family transport system substrate-binding protein